MGAHDGFAFVFEFENFPGEQLKSLASAKGRAAIGVTHSRLRFVQHCPDFKAAAEFPATAVQRSAVAPRLRQCAVKTRFGGQRFVRSLIVDVKADSGEGFRHKR